MQVTFNILQVTLTQKIITHRLSKIHEWFWVMKFFTLQPQNKGPGMFWGWSYITPMISRDIVSMIEGVGCVTEEGVCHGTFKLDNFHMIFWEIPHKPA